MLQLYAIPESLYCAKLRIVLRHKSLPWQELLPPGGYGSDEYKQIIPSGNLPALIDNDLVLADSEAIAEYLNEKHPQPPMWPLNIKARAKARERSRFHDTRLEPELRKLFPFITNRQGAETVAKSQSVQLSTRLQQLALLLADNKQSNNDLSLGDCGFPVTFTWIEQLTPLFDLDIQWPDQVIEYQFNLNKHHAVADELASYTPTISDWLATLD